MGTVWTPQDIAPICLHEQAPLESCMPWTVVYLTLLTRLYGGVTISLPEPNPYSNNTLNSTATTSEPELENTETINQYNQTTISQNGRTQQLGVEERVEYDFIIVGAGSAGCVLANRLSEVNSWRILLLEAGTEEPDITSVPALASVLERSSIDWNYRTQPEQLSCRSIPGQTCPMARGKTMGGSSAINYMIYMRGNRLDYDHWAELGNPGWSYNEVLPYFRRAENNRNREAEDTYYHGVGGPLNVERFPYTDANTLMLVEGFSELGLTVTDLNANNNLGTEIVQSTSKNGQRWSANMAYVRPIRNIRSNIDIIVNAFVTKVIIDSNTKTAQGVTYLRNGVYINVFARKEVIISCGALNSPKLLMLSGVGPERHLQSMNISVIADLQVGQNFQDHVTTEALTIGLSNRTSTFVTNTELLSQVTNYYEQPLFHKNGPLSTSGTFTAVAFIKTQYAVENAPDIQYHFESRIVNDLYADPDSYLNLKIFPFTDASGLAARPILLTPQSRGQILLNQTDPVFSQPLIYPQVFTVRSDVDVLIEGMQYVVGLERTRAFVDNGAYFIRTPVRNCESYDWGTYDYFYCLLVNYTAIYWHSAGTCKMGPAEDRTAVVDARLRVYGINRLRVVDTSIMPSIIRGNTNAPTMMIGEKASDMIKEDHLLNK